MEPKRTEHPTVDELNALPDRVRRYIHDLREERDRLQQRVEELEAREREYLEAPIETD